MSATPHLQPPGGLLLSMSSCAVIASELARELRGVVAFSNPVPEIIDQAISALPEVPSASPWLTSSEAAAHLRIGLSELQRLAAAGVIPSEQDSPGGRRFFDREDLDHWRRSGGRANRR